MPINRLLSGSWVKPEQIRLLKRRLCAMKAGFSISRPAAANAP